MLTDIKPLFDWLHLHPQWAGIATLLLSLAESIAILGLFIPGSVVMTALGILVGSGVLSFFNLWAWASVGAILGDVLSFWLGYHYRDNINYLWPFHHYPSLLKRGCAFFQNYGGMGVFIGRFIGPLRPVLPLIAGMMSMRPARFLVADILSGLAWSPAYMLPGIIIGAASQQLAPHTATRLILLVFLILLVLWLVSHLIRRFFRWFSNGTRRILTQLWLQTKTQSLLRWLSPIIRDPNNPQSPLQLGLLILFLLTSSALIVLAINVYQHGILTAYNIPLYHLMRALRTTFADQIMVGITFIGEPPVMIMMWSVVLIWLAVCRYWRAAIHWLVIGLLAVAGAVFIKPLIHSLRPTGILKSPSGWSFPSGHATLSVTLFGFLAILLATGKNRLWCWLAFLGAAISATLICISRLYLGAHWLTDVCGGILLGCSCITLLTLSYRRKLIKPVRSLGILVIALLSLAIAWSVHFHKNFTETVHNYTPFWPTYTVDANGWWLQTNHQVPLYRVNRFDKPIQILNIQWMGLLPNIQQKLSMQGWHKTKISFVLALDNLMSSDPAKQLPVLSQLYEDRKPVLIMMKYLPQAKALLVLRLWDAHLKISGGQPLWLGTVNFHKPWNNRFLGTKEKPINTINAISPTDLLAQDLASFQWKQISYPDLAKTEPNWDGKILLIMPK